VSRHRETAKLSTAAKNLELEQVVAQEAEKVQVGDAASVVEFVRNFGSHYIASYVTGNSLYQVLQTIREL
jgi:torso-like protein